MAMTDGNPGSEPKEIKATIDPHAVASLVREMQKQDAQNVEKESRFQTKIKSLLATGTVDKDNLAEITALQEARIADLKDELLKQSNQGSVQSTQSRYAEAVSDALEKYTEGDDQLEATAELLHHKAMKKLAANSEVMAKFNAGQVDKQSVRSVAKEVVEDFSKNVLKRDKPSKGPAIHTGIPSGAAQSSIEKNAGTGTLEEITDPARRESYLKLKSAFQRWGRMAPADATAKAHEHANRQVKVGGKLP